MKTLSTFLRQLTLAVLMSSLTGLALAEGQRGEGKPPKPDFTALFEQLQLSDEKRSALQALMKKHHEARREGAKGLREQHRTELGAVLTDEQVEIFESYMKSNRPPRRHSDKK